MLSRTTPCHPECIVALPESEMAVSEGRLVQLGVKMKLGECPHFATPTLHRSLVLVGTMAGVTAVRTS
jgi:hypothetical protein